jgi:hypothetical protein
VPDTTDRKDVWDRLTALATILVPAAIALAGHFVAQGLQRAQISSSERQAEQSNAIADANTKIAQAGLISTMMKSLTSTNAQERKLAVAAVLIALPEQGPVLARTIAQSDDDESVKLAAQASLKQRVNTLIRDLFAESAAVRVVAAQNLIQGWQNEPNAVQTLVEFANQNLTNANGVFNTVIVLNQYSLSALQAHRQLVTEFLSTARQQGPQTAAKVTDVLRRLGQ